MSTQTNKTATATATKQLTPLTLTQLEKLDPVAAFYILNPEGTELLDTTCSFTRASRLIEDTCNIIVFSRKEANTYTPKQERSCSAEVAGLGGAQYNFGNTKNKSATKAKTAHDMGVKT